ncbi:MAG TPA: universal stress protein [Candidatus Limnocylindrales bacterium]|nr:universal stress protein [Candidatus Limnocylindrales bacterium]
MTAHRILVAYDGSESARRALRNAADVAASTGASIGVVTVLPAASVPTLEAAAAEAVETLRDRGLPASLVTPTGDPATEIVRAARDGGYDTIYVGSRPGGSLARVLLGSVSDAVAVAFPDTVVAGEAGAHRR